MNNFSGFQMPDLGCIMAYFCSCVVLLYVQIMVSRNLIKSIYKIEPTYSRNDLHMYAYNLYCSVLPLHGFEKVAACHGSLTRKQILMLIFAKTKFRKFCCFFRRIIMDTYTSVFGNIFMLKVAILLKNVKSFPGTHIVFVICYVSHKTIVRL